MANNKTLILEEFEKYKGQFIITESWTIERLVAISEDEWDYYYVTFDGRDIKYHTCLGRIIPLKGYLRDKDYNSFVNSAILNHYDQIELKEKGNMNNFLEAFNKEIVIHKVNGNKYLTDFCWDLDPVTIKDIRKQKLNNISEN